jgi:hypothetical protein
MFHWLLHMVTSNPNASAPLIPMGHFGSVNGGWHMS